MSENNLFDLKKRINATVQTRKITRTMELIASSRLQRCKMLQADCREWAGHMREAAMCLPDAYFQVQTDAKDRKAYIIFGGSKGLSGAYGPSLLNFAKPLAEGQIILAAGSSAEAFFPDAHSFFPDAVPSAEYARTLARTAREIYAAKEADEVYMLYTRSAVHISERLFPLTRTEKRNKKIITEPSAKVLFPALFEEYSDTLVYQAHLQAFISEQIAKVSAMDSATRNADDIIDNLQAAYNRIRQSSITQEIITISNAVKGD